jgi:polyhydroxyalkanoate synthase
MDTHGQCESVVTLLTTMLDFSDTGEIGLLIDQGQLLCERPRSGRAAYFPERSWPSPLAHYAPMT